MLYDQAQIDTWIAATPANLPEEVKVVQKAGFQKRGKRQHSSPKPT